MSATLPIPTREEDRLPINADLRDLYLDHRWELVRLASLLLPDLADAEEVTQDAFVKTHLAWGRVRDPDKALAYLRSAVLNGARSRLRHLKVVARTEPVRPGWEQSAETTAMAGEDRRSMIGALRSLPDRQRECLALRYYLDLPEAEIASTLGISTGSVKTHIHRGLAALSSRLESIR
jgi:RNA polymerase sigma-70 factor (sigma-E family)